MSFPGTSASQLCPPSVSTTLLIYLVAQSGKSGHTESASESSFLSPLAAIGLVQILKFALLLATLRDLQSQE